MFQTGDQIGSFSLIKKLGKGTFGEVWLAEEKTAISAHKVALKLPNEDDVDLEAIRQEADVWESVKGHPNILPIIKADIYEGQIYIASEYAPDGSLSEWLKGHGGKAPTTEIAVRMIQGILAGLGHLHSKGVIHRDLKPANILLQSDTPRIADFGIARLAKAASTTNSTMSAGTPSYMAPECFYSVRSEQTDIWAVGVLFHKLLTGKLPFSHPDQVSVMNAILNSEPNIDAEIPENLRQVIARALQKDTAQRYQSVAEMRGDLDNFTLAAAAITAGTAAAAPETAPSATPRQPVFEKEEETVVRAHPSEVYVRPVESQSSNQNRTLTIALVSLLVLGAVTVWAALQFAGDEPAENQAEFSNSANGSNGNSNSISGRTGTGTQTNSLTMPNERINLSNSSMISNIQNPASTDANVTGGAKTDETPTATPYNIQPDESAPNVNVKTRPRQTETPPASDADATPTPAPSKTPTATPIEIAPIPTPVPGRRSPRPTPKATAQPEQTPPPAAPKNEDLSESEMNFRDL